MSTDNIAVWPDGTWCEMGELDEFLQSRSDDYEIVQVQHWDDHGEPLLPQRFARYNWE